MFRGRMLGLVRLGRPGLLLLVVGLMVSGSASAFVLVDSPKASRGARLRVIALDDHYVTTASRALNFGVARGVLANDSDSQGFGLTLDELQGAGGTPPLAGRSTDGAWVTMGAKGSFSYNPAGSQALRSLGRGEAMDDTFTYGVSDGHGGGALATVTITVTGPNRPPALGNLESTAASYDAGTPAIPVSSTLVVSDPDDADLSEAMVSITSGFIPGEDSLSFANQNGITGSYDSGTGVLTLSGSAPVDDYQAALRSVSYSDADGTTPTTGTRTISFQVEDAHRAHNLSNVVSRGLEVNPNNPPTAADDSAYTDKNTAIDIPVLANDSDSDADVLSVASADTTGTKGLVSIKPNGSIRYDPNGQFAGLREGQTATDTFTYEASDGYGDSGHATVKVTVNGANDPPMLSYIETTAVSYSAGTPAVPVSSSLDVADGNDTNLAGATVSITSGLASGEDLLSFTTQNGIAGSYDSRIGVLTLSGSASLADYQAALRSVTYSDADGTNPTTGTRTVSFQVNDGHSSNSLSSTSTRDIDVNPNPPPTARNDSASTDKNMPIDIPVVANDSDGDGDTVTSEGGSQVLPYAIQQNQAIVDNQLIEIPVNSSSTKQALVCDGSSNSTSSTEMYNLQVNGCPLTEVNPGGTSCPSSQLSPPSCLYEFTTVDEGAGFDAGQIYRFENGATWLGGVSCASPTPIPTNNYAQYQATGTVPAADPRAITLYIVPDGSFSSTSHLIPILGYAQFYAAGWDHDPCINRSDPDSPDGRHVGRVWGYVTGLSRSLKVASVNTAGTKGSVSVNPSGTVRYDPAGAFAALQEGQTATDTFTYQASDGYHDSTPATVTVTIRGTNDPPALSHVETTALSYTAGAPAVPVTSALTLTDDDDTNLAGARVSITSGFASGEDSLSFNDQNGISGSYNSATGVLTLTGTASLADYQAALRSVSYSDTNSNTPTTGTRTISIQADDGHTNHNLSNTTSRDIQVN